MTTEKPVAAAQYLRMSTEHQQYSLENQSAAIQRYAELHGFKVVETYVDTAKSGVTLRRRTGLQRLLQDVVGAKAYHAILVYDVSRWGRFQDTDEAAHYEFLCKSAGAPVHYCAETFANDGSLPSLIMKALKRTMAGEYSRELGVKVLAGQKRLALLGFKQGGLPGYGLRRMLVSPNKIPKQSLNLGERKSIATDRVVLVPGPNAEVECVKDIFRMLTIEKRTVYSIAMELNKRGVPYVNNSTWDYQAVFNILTHPKYAGYCVFARTSRKLYTPTVRLPRSQWVLTRDAFEPLVDIETFEGAQAVLQARTINKSDDEVLGSLRELLRQKGRLSHVLVHNSPITPSPSTYRHRFGSLRRAYRLIGYEHPDRIKGLESRQGTFALRDELFARILGMFPGKFSITKPSARWRSKLRTEEGRIVSVLIARAIRPWQAAVRWVVNPVPAEGQNVTLLVRLNEANNDFMDFHVFSKINTSLRYWLSRNDWRLRNGKRLQRLSKLYDVVDEMTHTLSR